MALYFSPVGNSQVVDTAGNPLVGGYWNVFLAGTTTPVATYTSNTGGTTQPTNIELDSAGRPANPIWLTGGVPVKFRLYSAAAALLLTIDNVSGVNDPAGATAQDQWVLYGAAPTYISATSFSVTGDQTNTFHIGRRIKSTNSGGTVYSTITNSVYASVTTVTVSNDSGTLDAGMSAVSYGLITATNTSAPTTLARSGSNTDITSLGVVARASFAVQNPMFINGQLSHSRAGSAETIAIKTLAGGDPSSTDPVTVVFRNATATTGDYSVITLTAATSITITNTATMGCSNGVAFRLWVVAFNDAGTLRLGVIKCASATGIYPLAAWGIASSTAMSATSDLAQTFYTGSAVTSKPYTVLGYSTWESGLAAIGVWDTAPSRTQTFGPGVKLPMDRLQCVINSTGGGIASSSTSYVDITNATLSITMTSAANAVLVQARGSAAAPVTGTSNVGTYVQLLEGSTVIDGNYLHASSASAISAGWAGPINQMALRFPNSASALTYKMQQKAANLGAGETCTTSACNVYAEELMT